MIVNIIILSVCFISIYITVWFLLLFLQKNWELREEIKLKKFPKVSVIIPAHNEEKNIGKVLRSLLRINYPKNKMEIIVVDDGSSDRTYEVASKFEKEGVKIYRKKRGGKASALNYGIKKTKSNLILTMDADCFLEKDALIKMVSEIQDENTMAVVPSIEVYKPKNIFEKIQEVEYAFMNFFRNLTASIYALPITPGAVVYKSQFLKKYGGFDEKSITEDFEMGLKINSHNFKVGYVFDAKVYTIVPDNFKKLMRQRVRWRYGAFIDLKKYKNLIGFKYGDLGAFILPQIPLYTGILLMLLFMSILITIFNTIRSLYLLELVGWEITFSHQLFNFYSIIDIKTFLFILMFLLSLSIYFSVKKARKRKLSFMYFLAYVLIYVWVLAAFEIINVFYLLSRKKPKW